MHTAIAELEQVQIRDDIPDFRPGDTLKVHVRVKEGNRSRIQVFQGVVIRRQGGGLRETFTVRKVSYGVGVERTFPVHSPSIDKIEPVTRGRVRRAKLYYLRDLRGKAARIKERREHRRNVCRALIADAAERAPTPKPGPTAAPQEPGIRPGADSAAACRTIRLAARRQESKPRPAGDRNRPDQQDSARRKRSGRSDSGPSGANWP